MTDGVGPNGAGKITTLECITGLRVPDDGWIRVLGWDWHVDRDEVRQRVGVLLKRVRARLLLVSSRSPSPLT